MTEMAITRNCFSCKHWGPKVTRYGIDLSEEDYGNTRPCGSIPYNDGSEPKFALANLHNSAFIETYGMDEGIDDEGALLFTHAHFYCSRWESK